MAKKNSFDNDEDPLPKQAVSLARRMAGKKGAVVQLQTEVNTEDDWDKLLTRDGLIVVDVYSDWCGPCVGMVGNLKKVKLEIGGDMLHLAIAKSDDIDVLARFRNKSEPTWMFIAGGQLVNVMFGANAPKLVKLIETELKNEMNVMKDGSERKFYPFDQLTPEEQERFEASEKLRIAEEKEEAARQLALRNDHRNRRFGIVQNHLLNETVVICMPHTLTPEGCVVMPELEKILSANSLLVREQCQKIVTPTMFEEIFYRVSSEMSPDWEKDFALGPALCLLLQGPNTEAQSGEIEQILCEAINEVTLKQGQEFVTPSPDSVPANFYWHKPVDKSEVVTTQEDAESTESKEPVEEEETEMIVTDVPGLYTPASALSKCAAAAQLFPAIVDRIPVLDLSKLPPRVTVIFETNKGEECFSLAEELKDEILGIGYFDKADPDKGVLLAKTPQQYAKVAQSAENKLVVVVSKKTEDPLLNLASLGPIYVSPDDITGMTESDKYFPPGVELHDDDEEGEGEGREESELAEGGLTPVTAVTES